MAEKCFKRIIDDSKIKEDIVDASLKLARFVYTPWGRYEDALDIYYNIFDHCQNVKKARILLFRAQIQ